MCSWCWGFRPVWQEVQEALRDEIEIKYLLGGLASDSQEPMSVDMQNKIGANWRRIQQEIPDTKFNYEFWNKCLPRRSTYPACRAIIACKMQDESLEHDMLLAIQQAYYLNAENPSDESLLIKLAGRIGLDIDSFIKDIRSDKCQHKLIAEIKYCRDMNINSFPSLLLKRGKSYVLLEIDYNNSNKILNQIM